MPLRVLLRSPAPSAGGADLSIVATEATLADARDQLVSIKGFVDQLEGYLDQVEAKLDTIAGHVDGLEAAAGAPADAEAASGNGSQIALLKNLRSRLGTIESYLDGVEGELATIRASVATAAKQDTQITHLATIAGKDFATAAKQDAQTTELQAIAARVPGANEFARIAQRQFLDTEEVRMDIPAPSAMANAHIYLAVAPASTATNAASWKIVRITLDANKNPSRQQYRTGVAWDSRTTGWPA
jgi:hypothetical protein